MYKKSKTLARFPCVKFYSMVFRKFSIILRKLNYYKYKFLKVSFFGKPYTQLVSLVFRLGFLWKSFRQLKYTHNYRSSYRSAYNSTQLNHAVLVYARNSKLNSSTNLRSTLKWVWISRVTMSFLPTKLGYFSRIHDALRWKWTFCGSFVYRRSPVFRSLYCRISRHTTTRSSGGESRGFFISLLQP